MTAETTLARAAADLAAGRIPVARQRLRGLVSSCPANLEARRRLGAIYRLYGEPAEAGRWTYLDADRDEAETAAFEARYAHPFDRMRAIAWRGPESAAGSALAEERLARLRAAATAEAGQPVRWWSIPDKDDAPQPSAEDDDSDALFWLGCGAGLLVALFLLVLGAVTFVGWWL